jgi:hypothetical protein|tara:strand:+ start:2707 stop:3201 length:495 start_codon:yes stop_codon:yes gene_type:complete
MTKKDLVKIIREVVKIEVKKQVKEILIKENRNSSNLKSLVKPTAKKRVVKKKDPVHYTDNQSLNDILNETVGLNDKSQEMDEYPTMGGGAFDSSRAAELLGYGDGLGGGDKETQRNIGAVQTMREAGVTSEQLPDSVVNALTKDYSGVMKAIEKKKKGGGGFRP